MIVTKTAAIVKDVSDQESGTGEFEVVLSAATLDRDGEVIDSRAFDPLPDHIPFDIDHGMTVTTTVGSGTPSYNDAGQLIVKGTYASTPLAQEVRTLVKEGHVRTTSVTFMAATREQKDGVPHVTKAELLNGTFTPIPSNREAVVLSGKSLAAVTEEKVGARNSASDATTIQGMHDASVDLGAACSKSHAAAETKTADVVAKALSGSYEERERAVYDAVSSAYSDRDKDVWAYPVATFDDNVVFRVSGGGNAGTWRSSYTIADDGTATLGTPEKVVVTEVVTAVSDTEQSADKAASESAAADRAAADADTAKSADEGSEMQARKSVQDIDIALALGG